MILSGDDLFASSEDAWQCATLFPRRHVRIKFSRGVMGQRAPTLSAFAFSHLPRLSIQKIDEIESLNSQRSPSRSIIPDPPLSPPPRGRSYHRPGNRAGPVARYNISNPRCFVRVAESNPADSPGLSSPLASSSPPFFRCPCAAILRRMVYYRACNIAAFLSFLSLAFLLVMSFRRPGQRPDTFGPPSKGGFS